MNVFGSEVTVNADGTFVHTISLSSGENSIKVTVTDVAGNVTAQDVIISRINDMYIESNNNGDVYHIIRNYLPLILSFVVSIALLVTIILVRCGYGKTTNKLQYILRTIRNISIIFGALLLCGGGYYLWRYMSLRKLSSGEGYFAIAQESIDKAFQVLKDMEWYGQLLKYIGPAIGICVLLTVILNKAIKVNKNRNNKTIISPEESRVTDLSIETLTETSSEISTDGTTIITEPDSTSPDVTTKSITTTDQIEHICRKCGAKYDNPVNFCEKCGEPM